MPVYEYLCQECGYFDRLRPMSQSQDDSPCPDCGLEAKRVVSAPHLNTMANHTRKAHETNERSRHEPRVSQQPGCCAHGTCSHHGAANSNNADSAMSQNSAEAGAKPRYKAQKGARRPWMISH